ncbi:MAG TPA: hypothetical protein VER96_02770 [Polyangiaceae bacterium]|nr:hypothetical protein [Polyangiaceae bacterium]
MNERRHQAASLVSLLVVTQCFVWACSSSDHEAAAVTASGGAGSKGHRGGAPASESESTSELGSGGGRVDIDSPALMSDGGAPHESPSPNVDSPAAGESGMGGVGASSEPDSSQATGGTIAISAAGASNDDSSNAGASGSGEAGVGGIAAVGGAGGSVAAGGASEVSEPVCDPAEQPSNANLFLPCDVSTALYVCRNCHSNPPVKGVFSSYVTYADIKANAAQIYGVIKSGVMPRPPYTMSTWQKSTALDWLGKNGSCAIGATQSCQ